MINNYPNNKQIVLIFLVNDIWIRHVDPNTQLPFYYNKITKESTWEIPDEFQCHLPTTVNTSFQDDKKSLPNHIMPNVNSRKRRRIKRAWLRSEVSKQQSEVQDTVPVEFLSEYIAYSDSDSEDSKSDSFHSSFEPTSPTPEMEPKSPLACILVGPRLPSPEAVQDDDTGVDSLISENAHFELIGPQPPPNFNLIQKVKDTSAQKLDKIADSLMDKFAYFDPQADQLSSLQLMYIQLSVSGPNDVASFLILFANSFLNY